MTTQALYNIAERDNIVIDSYDLPDNASVSVCSDGEYFIALDRRGFRTEADERVHVAHELGHCERGAFYNIYAVCDVRGKHERRADEWAIRRLVPMYKLKAVLRRGDSISDIADEFTVTERFIKKAIELYFGE